MRLVGALSPRNAGAHALQQALKLDFVFDGCAVGPIGRNLGLEPPSFADRALMHRHLPPPYGPIEGQRRLIGIGGHEPQALTARRMGQRLDRGEEAPTNALAPPSSDEYHDLTLGLVEAIEEQANGEAVPFGDQPREGQRIMEPPT
jgi:hypothetical protein